MSLVLWVGGIFQAHILLHSSYSVGILKSIVYLFHFLNVYPKITELFSVTSVAVLYKLFFLTSHKYISIVFIIAPVLPSNLNEPP